MEQTTMQQLSLNRGLVQYKFQEKIEEENKS